MAFRRSVREFSMLKALVLVGLLALTQAIAVMQSSGDEHADAAVVHVPRVLPALFTSCPDASDPGSMI